MTSVIQKNAVDLAWSLWTELGVPGVVQKHRNVAIDPEPLLVVTPSIAASDARLLEQVARWSALHGDWLAASRVQGTLKKADDGERDAFVAFAASIPGAARWVHGTPSPREFESTKMIELPFARPALARLRLRALCGVGARADVLAELIAQPTKWLVASDLEHLSYTKRNVARILSELTDAGFTLSMKEKNAVAYRLPSVEQWKALVCAGDVSWPSWTVIFEFVRVAVRLEQERGKSEIVRRVAATKAVQALIPLCDRLQLERPPATTGEVSAWEMTMRFVEAHVAAFANGTSRVMGQGARAGSPQAPSAPWAARHAAR